MGGGGKFVTGNWWCRNDKAYNGKTPMAKYFNRYLSCISKETGLPTGRGKSILLSTPVRVNGDQPHEITCMSESSWKERWQGGMVFLVKKKGQHLAYKAVGWWHAVPSM